MQILIYAPNYLPATRYGGPVRSSHGLAKALAARGHEVHVVTTNVDGPDVLDVPLATPVDIDGVTVRYFAITTPRRIYHSPGMGRAVDAEAGRFDIVHINGMFLWPGPRLARAAIAAGVPLIVSPRGMLVPELIAGRSTFAKRAWIRLHERRRLAAAAAIHVTSEEEAQGVRRLGLDLAPLKVVGNGVDLPHPMPSPDAIERFWAGIPPGCRVAFLGRLDWTKGADLAIDAVARVPGAHLLIAGHDQIGLRAALEPRLAVGRFIGPVNDTEKWALLAGADVLIAPSIKESFGIAVAEALALGTPVICTEGVGAAAIIRRIDPAGIAQRTVGALAEALTALLADAPRRAAYSWHAREIMAAEFTWPAIARQMEQVYLAASADSGRRRRAA